MTFGHSRRGELQLVLVLGMVLMLIAGVVVDRMFLLEALPKSHIREFLHLQAQNHASGSSDNNTAGTGHIYDNAKGPVPGGTSVCRFCGRQDWRRSRDGIRPHVLVRLYYRGHTEQVGQAARHGTCGLRFV